MLAEHRRPCRCGNQGCWENSANQSALIDRVRARLEVGRRSMIRDILAQQNASLSLAVITQAAEAGDGEALAALNETATAIGIGAANLINIFNPEMIIIGGALSMAGKFLLPSILKVVKERALDVMQNQVEILLSVFGPDASVMGAVAIVVRQILAHPASVGLVRNPQETRRGGEKEA
jgi:N-acetylglucosamine repressor